MKAKATLAILALLALPALALAAETSLTTTDGQTYDHITALRADPDGLYLEYATPRGGLGVAKIKFTRLSPDLQKQYGYNPDAAKKFEDANYHATQTFITWANQQQAARDKAAADRDARELQEQTLATQRAIAEAQTAQASQPPPPPPPYYTPDWSYSYGYGYGGFAVGRRAPRNTWTGEVDYGTVPYGTLFTPIGFRPNKPTFIPATPNRAFTAPRSHQESSGNF